MTTKRRRGQRGPDRRPRRKRGQTQKPQAKDRPPALGPETLELLRACHYRVAANTPSVLRDLADMALVYMGLCMVGKVPLARQSTVLKAALAIREEVCGQVARRIELSGSFDLRERILDGRRRARLADPFAGLDAGDARGEVA